MSVNIEEIKKKIYDKLPDLLPKFFKTIVVHIVMMIYHISMPPWVTAIKIKRSLRSLKGTKETGVEETENNRRRRRRRARRSFPYK